MRSAERMDRCKAQKVNSCDLDIEPDDQPNRKKAPLWWTGAFFLPLTETAGRSISRDRDKRRKKRSPGSGGLFPFLTCNGIFPLKWKPFMV